MSMDSGTFNMEQLSEPTAFELELGFQFSVSMGEGIMDIEAWTSTYMYVISITIVGWNSLKKILVN
jgi:hypothetical protein